LSIIAWEDPPSNRRRKGRDWSPVAADLKAHPGKWARIFEGKASRSLAGNISMGVLKAFQPKNSFQGAARQHDGEVTIWARYVGENGEYDTPETV